MRCVQMKNVINLIKKLFKEIDWKYDFYEEDNVFATGIDMGNVLGNIKVFIFLEEDGYNVYLLMNTKVEKEKYAAVAEFLHRANYGLRAGNFEMDYRDGEVRYKTYVDFKNININEEIVVRSIFVGADMINRYGKGLMKVMLGLETAEKCVEECETLNDNT